MVCSQKMINRGTPYLPQTLKYYTFLCIMYAVYSIKFVFCAVCTTVYIQLHFQYIRHTCISLQTCCFSIEK